jgi:hypothetical protein
MILVSLHTKSSSMFHAEFAYKLFPPKWRILTMKTLSYKLKRLHMFLWPNNITTFFPFPVMFYLPCADHVLLFVDDVVTCWPQTKISDWSEIKCIVIIAVHNRTCSTQSVYHATSKSCMIQSNSTFTLYFLVYDTSIMILHGVYS